MYQKLAVAFLLGAAFICAAPIFTTTVTITGVNGATDGIGDFTSPYYLSLANQPLTTFDAWCANFAVDSGIGEVWQANVYSGANLTGANLVHGVNYNDIFWIVEQAELGLVNQVTASEAIWFDTDISYTGSTPASMALLSASVAGGNTINPALFEYVDGTVAGVNQPFVIELNKQPAGGAPVSGAPEPSTLLLLGSALCMIGRKRFLR